MKTALFSLCFLVLLGSPAFGQMDHYGLPPGGQVIEIQPIQSTKHPHRALLLWMLNPLKVPRDNPDDPYTCPEYTRGSHYNGPTRVSLVDPQTKKIINTIKIPIPEGEIPSISRIASRAGSTTTWPACPRAKRANPPSCG